ncbi:MAG: OmpA family protein [Magnetococcales bacterium]|nr:OmpA family protein [Magnetococcales bacterium]
MLRVSVLLLGLTVSASASWAAGREGGETTMFQAPPSPEEILDALGEKPKGKTRGIMKTRSIVVHDEADMAPAPPTATPVVPPPSQARVPDAADTNAASDSKPARKHTAQNTNRQAKKNKVAFPLTFGLNSATLTQEAMGYIDSMAAALQQKPELVLHISGHTDISGGETVNRLLSLRRADAVKQYLEDKHHIDSSRLTISGEGSHQLLFKDNPRAAENRRVEFARND